MEEEEAGLDIGDTIYILGGRLNKTRGVIYGFRPDRLALMAAGVADRIVAIPLVDGGPDPELGISEIIVLKKAAKPGFVVLLDLRAGQTVETFASGGVPSTVYTVKEVNEAADSALLADEAGEEEEFLFNFTGIPEGYPFEVMRARDAPAAEGTEGQEPQEEAVAPAPPLRVEDGDEVDDVPADAQPITDVHTFAIGAEIELPAEEELVQLSAAGRIYPDVFQRSEMLSQLIQILPEASQRNPRRLQGVRRMVEMMMYLRNEVVLYGLTGEPRGEKPTSLETLAELIQRGSPPLVRGVADMKKVIVLEHYPEMIVGYDEPADGGVDVDGLYAEFLFDTIERAETLTKEYADSGEGAAGTPPGTFYTYLETLRKTVGRPYTMKEEGMRRRDIEVFRLQPPGGEEAVPALDILGDDSGALYPEPNIIYTPFSIVRVLGGRSISSRLGARQIEPPEDPEVLSTLLFPRSVAREVGSIRSGSLAIDISLGMTRPRLMSEVIRDVGEPSDFPTADGLLLLGMNGIVGNIMIKEWIESQAVQLMGLGDAQRIFQGYGVSGIEWNMEQAAVLQGKIDATLASLRIFLARQREEATIVDKPAMSPLLAEGPAATLLALADGEPLLQRAIETLRGYMGAAADVDVIWFTTLAVAMPDLLLVALAQQPGPLVRERMLLVQKQRIQASENGYRLRFKLATAGEPPVANPCVHVANLEKIRRVTDDSDRTKLLAKFLGEYRSKTEDNWVWCNVCDEHLLCAHELLQIQQFARPKERDALHKEMLLHFSAGADGRHFLCSSCGQPLTDIDYDKSLEFDDEGRPMMGRSVMVDKEAMAEQEIADILANTAEVEEEITFTTEKAKTQYKVLKRIAGSIGIAPSKEDYQQLLDSMTAYVATLATREAYAAGTKGKKGVPDYDGYYSLRIVSAAAALILLDIQTRIPDYKIYFTSADCRGGFGGWPLIATDTPTTSPGLSCMSLVVAGINDDEEPWNLTGLQRQANLLKRRDALLTFVKGQVDNFIKAPAVQVSLARKREHNEKINARVGGVGRSRDQLRGSFRPVPYKVSVSEAAAEPIVAAGASPRKGAEAWIRSAHGLAPTGMYKSLQTPADAWTTLPALPISSTKEGAGVRAVTTFTPNRVKPLDASSDPDTYWRLFAHLCWRGDSMGRPHTLGIGLTCSECGLHFEEAPSLTAAREVVGEEEAARAAAKLITHMEGQGVMITEGTFTDLLDAAHRSQSVVKTVKPETPLPTFEVFEGYVPLEGWSDMLLRLQVSLTELGPEVSALQIATASEDLVRAIGEKEMFIRERIGVAAFTVLETFITKTPRECGHALMTAFLVPFQRWCSGLDSKTFKILDSYELSKQTRDDIIGKGLANHIKSLGEPWQLKGLARAKVLVFIKELSGYCRHAFPSLREGLTPGGKMMVTYLLRAYIMGAVQRLIDPHEIPEEVEDDEGQEGTGLRGVQRAFVQCLSRYSQGSRIPSDDEIRMDLEKRAEAEKQKFIKRLDKMSREQRKVELMNKALGIGEWAVGGTRAIREYDEERYEAERVERQQAGLVDYPEAGAEDGYDHEQQGEDEY